MFEDMPRLQHCRGNQDLTSILAQNPDGSEQVLYLPAASFPTTNVTGDDCCEAFLSAALAEERKDRRDARGRGMMIEGVYSRASNEIHNQAHCLKGIGRFARRVGKAYALTVPRPKLEAKDLIECPTVPSLTFSFVSHLNDIPTTLPVTDHHILQPKRQVVQIGYVVSSMFKLDLEN